MSLIILFLSKNGVNVVLNNRKCIKSLFLQLFYNRKILPDNKRHRHTPPFYNYRLRGTYTIEAAVIMPVFVCLAVFILLFFRILSVEWGIEASAFEVARESAIVEDSQTVAVVAATSASCIKNKTPLQYIKGGVAGVNYMGSEVSDKDVIISANYTVKVPVGIFGKLSWNINQQKIARRWIGYDPYEDSDESEDVFVTENGSAYHKSMGCVYLDPSIRATTGAMLETERNLSGNKYVACDRCHPSGSGALYVTNYGTVYHSTVTCSSLRRTINRIALKDAISNGYHSCSKCGG